MSLTYLLWPLEGIFTEYYCCKGFYSVILQGIIDPQCKFWDFDFGWPVNCHDWSVMI